MSATSGVRPGLGFFRVLAVSLQVDDRGLSRGMSRASAQVALFENQLTATANQLRTVQSQIAVLGFTAGAIFTAIAQNTAEFERTLTTAAISSGASFASLREEASLLNEEFALGATEAAELTRQIAFLGGLARSERLAIGRAASSLELLGGVEAPQAAQTLKRLTTITTASGEAADFSARRMNSLAGAIFRVGANIATGQPADIIDFLRRFQVVGAAGDLTPEEVVALGGAIADLNENLRSVATTFVTRAFQTDQFEALGQALGMSAEQVIKFRNQRPAAFLQRLGRVLAEAEAADRLRALQDELDLGGFRSIKPLLTFISNLDKFDSLLGKVQEDQRNVKFLQEGIADVTGTAAFQFSQMTAAIESATVAIGAGLVPALRPLIEGLEGLGDFLQQHRGVAAGVGAGAFGIVGLTLTGLIRRAIGLAFALPPGKSLLSTALKSPQLARAGLFSAAFGGQAALGPTSVATAAKNVLGAPLGGEGAAAFRALFGGGAGTKAIASVSPGILTQLGALGSRVGGGIANFFRTSNLLGGQSLTNFLASRTGGAIGGTALSTAAFNVFALLGLLQPVFGGLADVLQDISDSGDVLDALTEGLAALFRVLEFGGALVNEVLELLLGGVGDVLKFVFGVDVPGLAGGFRGVGEFFKRGTEFLGENRGFGLLQNNTVNVNVQDSGGKAKKEGKEIAKSFGSSGVTVVGG